MLQLHDENIKYIINTHYKTIVGWLDEPGAIVAIVAAIIALGSSVITAIITAIFTKKNEMRLRHLENDLAEKKAEHDARRDYEYEARKRLYQECEPILFQFAELSESALRRIYALARNAKDGNLGPDRYWLSTDHYFIRSTIYRLIAPMAAFKLLQHRLTNIDLKLDRSINIQYILAKILYYTFSSSPDLAKSDPAVPYDPDQIEAESKDLEESTKRERRVKYPEEFWLQGLKVGTIDILAETLIVSEKGGDNNSRIKSFGEFEQQFFKESDNIASQSNNTFEVFFTIFSYFHPRTRPVLWRVLITQAYLYNAIKNIRNTDEEFNISNYDEFVKLFEIEKVKSKCKWIQPHEVVTDEEFNISFKAAENYLKTQLTDVLDLIK
jgi:hypothetical protein